MFAKTNLKHTICPFLNIPAVLAPHSNSASWPSQGLAFVELMTVGVRACDRVRRAMVALPTLRK